ncbi:uncharacterized protein LOC114516994 [Dendronephthya gigantea]|uniref:uncharacterized protein LOC114516994 n=1 Tax=Dendronephthya gigantea TaxID=151771 RepID=UPI00106CFA70|nr:uncharacterized protein LOC114516994 [Dendronephthya gigantea]
MSIKCTPFCRPCDKGYKHHELLVTLLNTRESETICPRFSEDHELLKSVIDKHRLKGWDINTDIMEENVEFRFPLLHWACVLGKIRTVRWLLDQGFSPTVQTKETKETCVHRALVTLPDLTATKSGRWSMQRFETLLPYFRDCLAMGNHRQETPLHLAAGCILQNKCYKLYENVLLSMLSEVKKLPYNEKLACLNAQNGSGDTVLNLLASGCKSVTMIEQLMDMGADSMIVNKLNIGPLDNAERHGLVHVANALRGSFLRGCGVFLNNSEYRSNMVINEDSKKRRSERRSTYYSTMASLSMFCRGNEGDLEKSSLRSQQIISPSKDSEKSSKSNETDELDNVDVENIFLLDSEDDETSSHSSSILNCFGEHASTPLEQQNIALQRLATEEEIKHDEDDEDDLGMCTCSGDDNDENTIATNNNNEDQTKEDSDQLKLMEVMKEAGVLPNLSDVITRTKDGHLKRIQQITESITKFEESRMEGLNQERILRRTIEQKRRDMKKLKKELRTVRNRMSSNNNKRKLMEDECRDLRKKLICCETLLKTVPKDDRT